MSSIKSNKGFTLIEVSIVVSLLILSAIYQINAQSNQIEDLRANAQASQIVKVRDALQRYGEDNVDAIVTNTAIPDVTDVRAPTVPELRELGYLNQAFPNTSMFNSNFLTQLNVVPAGCVRPNCGFLGLVYLDQPIRNAYLAPSGALAGKIVDKIGAN